MTPEEFLTQSEPDEETAEQPDSLASIAESLRAIAGHLTADAWVQEKADDKASEIADLHAELRRAHEEIDGLQAQLEQVLALCKPSVGKLANSIREALQPSAPAAELEPEEAGVEATRVQPAHDASVEEWRAFARAFDGEGITDWSQLNRSQIRTALGIAHA